MNLSLRPSSNLGPTARTALYSLWEQNIKPLCVTALCVYDYIKSYADCVRAKGTDFDEDESSKREEMFEPTTRFLILLKHPTPNLNSSADTPASIEQESNVSESATGDSATIPKKKKKKKTEKLEFGPEELLGYCSFRFDTEQTLDDDRQVEVIYWSVCILFCVRKIS